MTTTSLLAQLPDEGLVELMREALREAAIPVDVRRTMVLPTRMSLTHERFDLYVPSERLDDALAVLRRVEAEAEAALVQEAGVPAAQDGEDPSTSLPAPDQRLKNPAWVLALAFIPIPMATLYAHYGLGVLFMMGGMIGLAAAGAAHPDALLPAWGASKILDVGVAWTLVRRWNRRIAGAGARA